MLIYPKFYFHRRCNYILRIDPLVSPVYLVFGGKSPDTYNGKLCPPVMHVGMLQHILLPKLQRHSQN